ncbi:hypothetical protein B0T16DRAFT_243757 [Cercophora newfieldiana]|uniref:Uncharacterized protein n=1 Tax=Cercophora newfieldiana TaxID=92897 RepID=A0AA39XSH0_9PEZI|nr:hypothetical protein B0T16DRAFT_243757 [Cercophora newfieldiana]
MRVDFCDCRLATSHAAVLVLANNNCRSSTNPLQPCKAPFSLRFPSCECEAIDAVAPCRRVLTPFARRPRRRSRGRQFTLGLAKHRVLGLVGIIHSSSVWSSPAPLLPARLVNPYSVLRKHAPVSNVPFPFPVPLDSLRHRVSQGGCYLCVWVCVGVCVCDSDASRPVSLFQPRDPGADDEECLARWKWSYFEPTVRAEPPSRPAFGNRVSPISFGALLWVPWCVA